MAIRDVNSIRETQAYILDMYPNENLTEDYIYAYVSRSVSYLCKNLSQKLPSTNSFIESIVWLMSLANKFGVDYEESMLRRYPGVCHYCLSHPCQCYKTNKAPANPMPLHKVAEKLEFRFKSTASLGDVDFDFMAKNIDEIYRNNEVLWKSAGPWHHLVKMQEEIGEIHEAYTGYLSGRKNITALSHEFADAMGWILGAWQITHRGVSLKDTIKDYYIEGCPVCSQVKCSCEPRAGRPKELLDERRLEDLKGKIKELSKAYPEHKELFLYLDDSFEVAIETSDEGLKKQAILTTKDRLAKLFEKTGDASKNANAIYKVIESIATVIGQSPPT